jgi:outer membrane cobalamin receptor
MASYALPVAAQTPAAPAASLPTVSQEIVVTATIAPISIDQVTRAVTVITREDLERWGIRSVIEGLRLVPGVDARARGPHDVQTDFSIRGATFGQNLVLADGLRLNDSQSGHHNGEIPLPALAVGRIEVLTGAGSTSLGADALGGAINVISRRDRHSAVSLEAGQHGLVDVQSSLSIDPLPRNWLFSGWGKRSDGFMYDREFALGGIALRGPVARGLVADVRHQRRSFGAAGFYGNLGTGAPAPSKEWTEQTVAALGWTTSHHGWTTTAQGLYRKHSDRFLWNILDAVTVPENRHGTDAAEVSFNSSRVTSQGATVAVGGLAGGDWVDSSNLGHRRYGHGSVFAEWRQTLADRGGVQAGLRFDEYSNFGQSWSPSLGAVVKVSPRVRARVSAARAFRVPTFTELYYTDPRSMGTPDLRAERGWSLDGGVELASAWTGSLSAFRRWDDDVIDWVRPLQDTGRFHAANLRDVTSTGFEASLFRRWAVASLRLYYAGLKVDAPLQNVESRYLLEYARHQSGGSVSVSLPAHLHGALNVDHRHRVDGQSYDLVSLRISRDWKRLTAFAAVSNLLDENYREIATVAMPGRWISAGFTIK